MPWATTECARCKQGIQYVSNRTRGYWTGEQTGALCNDKPYHHTPSPEYYRTKETTNE